MAKLIYQNPRRPKEISTPVDEEDAHRRATLERAGWVIIERMGESEDALANLALSDDVVHALQSAGYDSSVRLAEALDEDLLAVFQTVDGVGPKTAEELLLKVRDKDLLFGGAS